MSTAPRWHVLLTTQPPFQTLPPEAWLLSARHFEAERVHERKVHACYPRDLHSLFGGSAPNLSQPPPMEADTFAVSTFLIETDETDVRAYVEQPVP